jgi:hypothetical protein
LFSGDRDLGPIEIDRPDNRNIVVHLQPLHAMVQTLAIHILHHHEQLVVFGEVGVFHPHDIRVLQLAHDQRFGKEAFALLLAIRMHVEQQLDRLLLVPEQMLRPVHDSHPPCAISPTIWYFLRRIVPGSRPAIDRNVTPSRGQKAMLSS